MKIVTARQAMRYAAGFKDARMVDVEPSMIPVTVQYAHLLGGIGFVVGVFAGSILGMILARALT